jgi:hypothetical protein
VRFPSLFANVSICGLTALMSNTQVSGKQRGIQGRAAYVHTRNGSIADGVRVPVARGADQPPHIGQGEKTIGVSMLTPRASVPFLREVAYGFHSAAHPLSVFVYVRLPLLRTIWTPLCPHILSAVQADIESAVRAVPVWVAQRPKLASDPPFSGLACQRATVSEPLLGCGAKAFVPATCNCESCSLSLCSPKLLLPSRCIDMACRSRDTRGSCPEQGMGRPFPNASLGCASKTGVLDAPSWCVAYARFGL